MYQVGIDIGSSAAKTVVLRDGEIWKTMEMATGFSSRKTADEIYEWLEKEQVAGEGTRYGATGYGRVSVPYADKVITEITCHGKAPGSCLVRTESLLISVVRIQKGSY